MNASPLAPDPWHNPDGLIPRALRGQCTCTPVVLIPEAVAHPYRRWSSVCPLHVLSPSAKIGDLIESDFYESPWRWRVQQLITVDRRPQVRLQVARNRLIPSHVARVIRPAAPYRITIIPADEVVRAPLFAITHNPTGARRMRLSLASAIRRAEEWEGRRQRDNCTHPEVWRWGLHCTYCGTVDVHPPRGRRA